MQPGQPPTESMPPAVQELGQHPLSPEQARWFFSAFLREDGEIERMRDGCVTRDPSANPSVTTELYSSGQYDDGRAFTKGNTNDLPWAA